MISKKEDEHFVQNRMEIEILFSFVRFDLRSNGSIFKKIKLRKY